MKKILTRGALMLGAFVVFGLLAEGAYRMWGPSGHGLNYYFRQYFELADREEVTLAEAAQKGLVVPLQPSPRTRFGFAPDITFYICYSGSRLDYFDERNCVKCRINSCGIREREELCKPKPEGQRRVVCVGDSFTFGWGAREEQSWPRLVENGLRKIDDDVRTVNCGVTGGIYVDEYRTSLEHKFWKFDPDAVVFTLCLNDLIPTSVGLLHNERPPWVLRQSKLLHDLMLGLVAEEQTRIDPDRDLVQELLDLPDEVYPEWCHKLLHDVGRDGMWAGGGPQRALKEARDFCAERNVPFSVVIWPYFQSLGPDDHYPFTKIHRLVGAFCKDEGIPFLDMLPVFEGDRPTTDWWVNPADAHGNEDAQRHATPALTEFIGDLLKLPR